MKTSDIALSTQEKVWNILLEIGFQESELKPNAHFTHDLGFDSLDFTDFIMRVEMVFKITLPFELVEQQCKTIADSVLIVNEELKKATTWRSIT
jgi:acyl carrier protein